MNRLTTNFWVAACLLLALPGCNNDSDFEAAGTFEATEVTVSSEASGRILWLNLAEGDTVLPHTVVGAQQPARCGEADCRSERATCQAGI